MVKTITKIILASAFALSVAVPAFAQSSNYDNRTRADQHTYGQLPAAAKRAGNAFALGSGSGFQFDANSPAATGGGSIGYNQKLLED